MFKKVGISSKKSCNHQLKITLPLKEIKKKKQKWTGKKCLDAVKKKHRAWNKYIHTQSQINYSEYCKVRNACTKTTTSAKKKHEKNIVRNMKENPKDFWAYIPQKTKAKSGVSDH